MISELLDQFAWILLVPVVALVVAIPLACFWIQWTVSEFPDDEP